MVIYALFKLGFLAITFLLSINEVICQSQGSIKEEMCDLPVKELKKNADNFMMKKEYNNALEVYTLLIEKEPDVERHYYKRGQIYEKLKKYKKALQDLDQVLSINEESTNGFNLRARVYMSMGWCDEALDDYVMVLKLKPTHGDAKKRMPQAKDCLEKIHHVMHKRMHHQHEEAERILDELINNYGKTLHFLFLRAESRFDQQKYYEAVADLGSLLKVEPGETEALYLRALCYYRLTEYDAAKRHIKEIMKYDPDHSQTRNLNKLIGTYQKALKKAKSAFKESNVAEGIQFMKDAAAADSDHHIQTSFAYTELCEQLMNLKDVQQSRQYCEQALTHHHDKRLDICIKYAEFQLNHCDSEDAYDYNMRIWHKCREANGNRDTKAIHEGMRKSDMMKKRFRQKDKDYYKILGVAKDASGAEIRKKYRKLAKEMHPDRFVGSSEEELKEVENKFHKVAEAYEVLSDDELRARYDRGEDVSNPNAQQQQRQGFHGFPFAFQRGGQTFRFHF